MKLAINDRCSGHGRCYALAPNLIAANEYGEAEIIDSGEVPPDQESQATEALHGCPESAVELLS
ncbi:ferredoxin [Nocardioides marmoriginsengisoli]|uniref:Ferredoxin n=1 Tax=Nocardioides marmoriginsengisoli TaxID=661483 RepID=A0A3N0CIQ6_9ACTN|nr:ferredoxin [Nocardioides marmoriginsengisoli]RNL62896.1 ferredoxin [Nocardioides marmoriginsengisoli]